MLFPHGLRTKGCRMSSSGLPSWQCLSWAMSLCVPVATSHYLAVLGSVSMGAPQLHRALQQGPLPSGHIWHAFSDPYNPTAIALTQPARPGCSSIV